MKLLQIILPQSLMYYAGAVEDYPKTLTEFETRFSVEQDCRDYLFSSEMAKWLYMSALRQQKAWPVGEVLLNCDYRVSAIAASFSTGFFKMQHK